MLSRRAKLALATAAGAALLAVLVWRAGPARLVDAIARASPAALALAVAVYALFFLLRGLRWRMLVPHARVSTTTTVSAVGWLANSVLPLKGGDVLRAALLAKREKLSAGASAASVALERVLDLVGVAAVAALGLFLLPEHIEAPAAIERALKLAWLMPLAGIACLGILVAMRRHVARVTAKLGKLGHFIDTTIEGLASLARRPKLLVALLPLTLAVSLAQALVFAFLVRAFLPGTPFGLALGGGALFLLSFVVSVTPGNVGTYEAAFAAVFSALGVPWDEALSAAILTHVATTAIVATLGALGMLWLSLAPSSSPSSSSPSSPPSSSPAQALARAHRSGGSP